ncbi:MAG: TatD family hydrolase [Bacteroidales bacterium]|nr:TatD family hydrolase [Bacteroidales bacterium]
MLIDIHSHHFHIQPGRKVLFNLQATSLMDVQTSMLKYEDNAFLSLGIHPWDTSLWCVDDIPALSSFFSDHRVLLIGEIGLDKTSSVPFDLQKIVFEIQVKMAEQIRKPVLLHVVRTMSEIFEIKKAHQGVPAWIIHGFRGKRQATGQYITKGFYLSFGTMFKEEGLLACPIDRMFFETDENTEDIKLVYERAAKVLGCSILELESQVEKNFNSVFNK